VVLLTAVNNVDVAAKRYGCLLLSRANRDVSCWLQADCICGWQSTRRINVGWRSGEWSLGRWRPAET